MKLNEGVKSFNGWRLALATILCGCVADLGRAQPCAGKGESVQPNTSMEVGLLDNQADTSMIDGDMRCSPMSYIRCDEGYCHWRQGYIAFNQNLYGSVFYQNFRSNTVDCRQLRISSSRDMTCNVVDQLSCRREYVPLELISRHFSTHPAIQQLWESTVFLSVPEEAGFWGSWTRLPGSSSNPQHTSDSEMRYLVNVVPEQVASGAVATGTVIHEMGHGIFNAVLSGVERGEFTDLIAEIIDIVDLNQSRADRNVSRSDLSDFLNADNCNRARIGVLPNSQVTAHTFYLERHQAIRSLIVDRRGTGSALADMITASEEEANDIAMDTIKLHKLYAMHYFMRIASMLYGEMMSGGYDYLGEGKSLLLNFIDREAYAYLFSYSGCMTELVAPYFKPYLSDTGWLLRQYSPGAGNEVLAHNPYIYTPEGRSEIRREFRAFWRQLENQPSPPAAQRR